MEYMVVCDQDHSLLHGREPSSLLPVPAASPNPSPALPQPEPNLELVGRCPRHHLLSHHGFWLLHSHDTILTSLLLLLLLQLCLEYRNLIQLPKETPYIAGGIENLRIVVGSRKTDFQFFFLPSEIISTQYRHYYGVLYLSCHQYYYHSVIHYFYYFNINFTTITLLFVITSTNF